MDGMTIHGTVRGVEGAAVDAATLTLISPQGRQLARTRTGPDGGYRVAAPEAGAYVVIAAADGCQPQATAVVAGPEAAAHDIVLLGAGGLSGVVRTGADRRAVAGAMVVVTDQGGEVLATAKTGENGGFAIDELPDGGFTLAVSAAGYRPTALPVQVGGRAPARIEVTLAYGTHLQGTVRAGAARRPLRDARVTLVDADGDVVATATTGEDGRYAFTDLEAGEYTLVASGYPPATTKLSVKERGAGGYDLELGHPDA